MTKTVYQIDEKGYFDSAIILDDSDKSPSGKWNIPARCVEIEPPAEKDGYKIKWTGAGWEYEEEPKEETPTVPTPTFEELKERKLAEAGRVFAKRRDAIRFIACSDGNTYGFDCANEDITNFLAAWKAAEISGSTGYKVWLNETAKGLVVLPLVDFQTVFDAVRASQLADYAWYEAKRAAIEACTTQEELDDIVLEETAVNAE